MKVNIVDPMPYELKEFNRLLAEARAYFEKDGVEVIFEFKRECNAYVSTTGQVSLTKYDTRFKTSNKQFAIYPSVPNAGAAQMKCDIMCLVECLRDLGMEVSYMDEEQPIIEKVRITKAFLSGLSSVREIKKRIQGTDFEKRVEEYENNLRGQANRKGKELRITKKQIIALLSPNEEIQQVKPKRIGSEWIEAKKLWPKEKFLQSNFVKSYKSWDDFLTFATHDEIHSN